MSSSSEDTSVPPKLPPRPAGKQPAKPPPPQNFSNDIEGDFLPDQVYDDCDEAPPPPLPEQVYDDCEEEQNQPMRRPPPQLPPHPSVPDSPQQTYDDLMEGPVVVPARQLPPPPPSPKACSDGEDFPPPPSPIIGKKQMITPQSVPPPPPPPPSSLVNSSLPPPPPADPSAGIYEVGNDGLSPPPPPPPPPPKEQKRSEPRPPAQTPGVVAAGPKTPLIQPVVDPNQLQGMLNNLRKVSVDLPVPENNNDPKTYGDCSQSVTDVKKKFQQRFDGKPALRVRSNSRPELGHTPPLLNRSCSLGGGAARNEPDGPPLPPRPANHNNSSSSALGSPSTLSSAVLDVQCSGGPSVVSSGPSVSASGPFSSVVSVGASGTSPGVPPISVILYNHHGKHTNMAVTTKPAAKPEPPPEEILPSDDIYDDACSGDQLERYDWFHGRIDRKEGETRIKKAEKDGSFLVRVSDKDRKFPYTLVILHKSKINNLRIRKRDDGKFALGEDKIDEVTFADVPAMISHHRNHHVLLLGSSQSQVKLQLTPPK